MKSLTCAGASQDRRVPKRCGAIPAAVWIVCLSAPQLWGQQFDSAGLDNFPSYAIFKVEFLDGTPSQSPRLDDPASIVGRSDPFAEGDEQPCADIFGAGPDGDYPNTALCAPDPCPFPGDFPEGPNTRWEVHTEILSFHLQGDGYAVRAGQAYWDNATPLVRNRFFQHSFGEVASHYEGDPEDRNLDFPADSVFSAYVQVTTPVGDFYNAHPMILRARQITQFPPDFGLPHSSYIHDPSFPAVALYNASGLHVAYLKTAGHTGEGEEKTGGAGGYGGRGLPSYVPDAPRYVPPLPGLCCLPWTQ